jgi:hypothetical protein
MSRNILVFLILLSGMLTADVIPSKDSLCVYNNSVMSQTDGLFLVNNGTDPVSVDSFRIVFDEIQMGEMVRMDLVKVMWTTFRNDTSSPYLWYMQGDSLEGYRLDCETGSIPAVFQQLHPGDTLGLGHFQIGDCFTCSALPRYPEYIRGWLILHFSNGNSLPIRLYSKDWRTSVRRRTETILRSRTRETVPSAYLLNGKKMENNTPTLNRRHIRHRIITLHP